MEVGDFLVFYNDFYSGSVECSGGLYHGCCNDSYGAGKLVFVGQYF